MPYGDLFRPGLWLVPPVSWWHQNRQVCAASCQELFHQTRVQCLLCPRQRAWPNSPLSAQDEGSRGWRDIALGRAAEAGSGGLLCWSQELKLHFIGDKESLKQFILTLWNELLQNDFGVYGCKRGRHLPVSVRVKKEVASQHKEKGSFPLMTCFPASLKECLLRIFQGPGQW